MSKKKVNKDLGRRISENLKENNALFWKGVHGCRREICVRIGSVLEKSERLLVT